MIPALFTILVTITGFTVYLFIESLFGLRNRWKLALLGGVLFTVNSHMLHYFDLQKFTFIFYIACMYATLVYFYRIRMLHALLITFISFFITSLPEVTVYLLIDNHSHTLKADLIVALTNTLYNLGLTLILRKYRLRYTFATDLRSKINYWALIPYLVIALLIAGLTQWTVFANPAKLELLLVLGTLFELILLRYAYRIELE